MKGREGHIGRSDRTDTPHGKLTRASRVVALLFSLSTIGVAGCATEYTAARSAIEDGSALRALDLNASDVKVQAQCWVAMEDHASSWCVYVQTADSLNLLVYDDETGTYVPAVSVPIADVTSVALATYGFDRDEVQLKWKDQLIVFETSARGVSDEGIYADLTAQGVASAEPGPWVEVLQIDPQPITIYY